MKSKVYITDCDHIDIAQETAVFQHNNVDFELLKCKSEDELIRNLGDAETAICQYAHFTETVFENLPKLKLLIRYGVGVDNIDVDAATRHGVCVCNVPDYGIEEVALHALTLSLTLFRKIIPMNESVHENAWEYERSIPIKRMDQCVIGIVGLGRIGSAFARQALNLKAKIIACDPVVKKPFNESIEMVGLHELLKQSDIVSLHCPLDKSRSLIGLEELKLMKKTAYLVNVSRGGIIDEAALDEALTKGWIAGAALDVLEREPITEDYALMKHTNLICTPHMAWYSQQSALDLKRKAAEEAVKFFTKEPIKYSVNNVELH